VPGMTVHMRTIRQVFRDDFSIGAFQRGYTWDHDNVGTLVRDFARAFERRRAPSVSGDYFLGTVVTHTRDGYRHIIDGQQRLTTLLLLLIWVYHEIEGRERRLEGVLRSLIVHATPQGDAFAIDVSEREQVFAALYDDPEFTGRLKLENDTDRTIVDRYSTISDSFPDALRGDQLKKFVEWMIDHVQMAVVEVDAEADAYTVFETTNDRGQKLGSGQLMKNFLQAEILDTDLREEALSHWTATMREMQRFGHGGDRDFVHEWLVARHADIPPRQSKASEADAIETDHFSWLKTNAPRLGLTNQDTCYRFMNDEMLCMADAFFRVRDHAEFPRRGWDSLYFLDQLKIAWTPKIRMVMLATVDHTSSVAVTAAKLRAAATFGEIFAARYFWQNYATNRLQSQSKAFLERTAVMVRDAQTVDDTVAILVQQINSWDVTFRSNTEAGLPSKSAGARVRNIVHTLLARMSACFDEAFGQSGAYPKYELRSANRGYTIEHVLPQNGSRGMFSSDKSYLRRRNRIGALVLVRAVDNQVLADNEYVLKVEAYKTMTRLARTFHESFYTDDAKAVLDALDLPFRPYDDFAASDVAERQDIYLRLAELTWSPDRIGFSGRPDAEEDSRSYALPHQR